METINNLAERVKGNLGTQEVVIDPMTMMLIASIVIEVIKAIKKCREKPQEAVTLVKYPNDREKKVLKRHVRRKLGLVKYWKEGNQYCNALLTTGQQVTTQEIVNAYQECGD
jgi:hypothetical protein